MYDVIIIGAGVCGCAVARELSRFQGKICVLNGRRMCAAERRRQTAESCMRALTQCPVP